MAKPEPPDEIVAEALKYASYQHPDKHHNKISSPTTTTAVIAPTRTYKRPIQKVLIWN